MSTYLLTWVQENWSWQDLESDIEKFRRRGQLFEPWSCGVTKKIEVDDRLFLIKLGNEPRGIVASGWAASIPYLDDHWDPQKAEQGQKALYVGVKFDTILRPAECFPFRRLEDRIYSEMNWSPQASGVTIGNDIAAKLEDDWATFLRRPKIDREFLFPDEAEAKTTFYEGAVRTSTVNYYERDPQAREACINHYHPICQVCEFDFEKTYGEIGIGFIHVHHLKPLSEIGKRYELNPIEDLRPVCPNCHSMLHKRKPAYSIEELIEKLGNMKG